MTTRYLDLLPPAQRFMYEYGCFVSFWSNFELQMEVVIWKLSGTNPIENCRCVNKLTASQKRDRLAKLFAQHQQPRLLEFLNRIFDVAERNDWIHGHILNPVGDFSRLTRFRVRKGDQVTNDPIQFHANLFEEFYTARREFEDAVVDRLGITVETANCYLTELQGGR